MTRLQSIKGMKDILPAGAAIWQHAEYAARRVLEAYGYREIRLPLLEKTEVFARSIGTQTDIVGKEMYTFTDRDGDSISLRPEGTAGCVRAGIQHGLFHKQQQRLYYFGPMFRHERPQRGRHRQFHQIGAEAVGWEGPDIDAELIALVARIWRELNLDEIVLEINSLGDLEARNKYREKLVEFLSTRASQLDKDSQHRLRTNPLRILDSKDEKTRNALADAPSILDSLDSKSRDHFESLQQHLRAFGIPFRVNPRLVRGLDYYSLTVFEWTSDRLGAQGTVCAGGRYDGLVEQLGGKPVPAVGFALGIERLVELVSNAVKGPENPDAYMVTLGSAARRAGMVLGEELRDAGLRVVCHCGEGSIKNQLKRADKSGAHVAVILGDDELASGNCIVKPLRGENKQVTVQQPDVLAAVSAFVGTSNSETDKETNR